MVAEDVRWGERQVLKLWIELARATAFNAQAVVRQGELWLLARAAGARVVRRVRLSADHPYNLAVAGRETYSMILEVQDRILTMGSALPAVL